MSVRRQPRYRVQTVPRRRRTRVKEQMVHQRGFENLRFSWLQRSLARNTTSAAASPGSPAHLERQCADLLAIVGSDQRHDDWRHDARSPERDFG
jgi:hypothetical protein